MPPVVSIVGKSESGKTTLLVKLIGELKKRGYRVMAIKHTREDVPAWDTGKDNWRLAQAGSEAAVLSSPKGTFLFKPAVQETSLQNISADLGADYDIVLAEGFKKEANPKIEVYRQELGPELACAPAELLAVVSSSPMDLSVPLFSPEDIAGIADFLEKKFLLTVGGEEQVNLAVNGQNVPLNPFTRRMFSGIILSMVSVLKNVPKLKSVTVSVRKRNN